MAKLRVRRSEDSGNTMEPICPLHRDRVAKAACEACGRFICEECRVDKNDKILCRECLEAPPQAADDAGPPILGSLDPSAGPPILGALDPSAEPMSAAPAEAIAPPPPPSAGGPACKNHPDRPPAAACIECKGFLCEECATNVDGQIICVDCRTTETIPTPEPVMAVEDLVEETPAARMVPKLSVAQNQPRRESKDQEEWDEEAGHERPAPNGGVLDMSASEKKALMITGLALAGLGAIWGFLTGGIWDPMRNAGIMAAIINLLTFAVWGVLCVAAMLVARNQQRASSRGGLILGGALVGGLFFGLICALDSLTNTNLLGSSLIRAVLSFLGWTGFGIFASALVCLLPGLKIELHAATTAPQSGARRTIIGVGSGCLAACMLALGFFGSCSYQVKQMLVDPESRQQGEQVATESEHNRIHDEQTPGKPVPKTVFGFDEPPQKSMVLEIAGKEYPCRIRDATVLTKDGDLLIATQFKPEDGEVGDIRLYINAPVLMANPVGKTLVLNDPDLPGGPESVRVHVNFRPSAAETELQAAIGARARFTSNPENARDQVQLIFGSLEFNTVDGNPNIIDGQLEVQLLPTKLLSGNDQDVVMKLYWRFQGEIPASD